MGNPFVHLELTTTDIGKAKEFYKSLFAWELKDEQIGPDMTYTMINVGEGVGGGMMQAPVPGMLSAWMPYVLVDDLVAATEKAKSLGAEICMGVTEVPGRGSFTIVKDPTGATIGFWKSKAP